MLFNLYFCITIMNLLIIFIAYFFAPSNSISDKRLRLSFIQSSLSGWETCTSCKIQKPSNIKDIKLEIQDVKDNVEFHFTHFEKQLNNYFSSIQEGIDNNYTNKFQKASESVIESLEKIKATININYKENLESLEGSGRKISEINSRLKLAKQEIPKFVANGLESFIDIFKRLKNEFTIKPSTTNTDSVNNVNNQNKSKIQTQNRSQPNSKTEQENLNENIELGNQNTKQDKLNKLKVKEKEENKVSKDTSSSTNNTNNSNSDNRNNKEVNDDSKNEPEKIDLESIPPEAIIRTVNSYLDDVNIEGKKLLSSILI